MAGDTANDVFVAYSPNQIFSADPFTFDDNRGLIPLSERFNDENNDIRFSITMTDKEFNEKLDKVAAGDDIVVFNLGTPSQFLIDGGVKDMPLKLYGNKVIKKQKKHGFRFEELRNLPSAMNNPIAVFDNYKEDGNRSVLTELTTAKGNFLVAINIGKGRDIDFDIVTTLFGKGERNIVNWIINGKMANVDKKKALDYLGTVAPIATSSDKQELYSAAKIVKEFELPNSISENNKNSSRAKDYKTTRLSVSPEQDAEYRKAYEEKDYDKTNKMLAQAFKSKFPNTRVVDENGNPKIVWQL